MSSLTHLKARKLLPFALVAVFAVGAVATVETSEADALRMPRSFRSVLRKARSAARSVRRAAEKVKKTVRKVKDTAKKVAKGAVKKGAKAVGDAVKRAKHAVKDAAHEVVKKTKSAIDHAKHAVVEASHWAHDKARALVKKGGSLAKKAWDKTKAAARKTKKWVSDGAKKWKKRVETAVARAKEVAKFIKEHKGDFKRGYDWLAGHLPLKGKMQDNLKKQLKEKGEKVFKPAIEKGTQIVKGLLGGLLKKFEKVSPQLKKIAELIKDGREILKYIKDPQLLVKAGKEKAIEMITAAAMKVLGPHLHDANNWLVGKAMGIAKEPLTQAVATGVDGLVAGATAGLGALATPVIHQAAKWGADKLVDMGIDKVKDKVGDAVYSKTESLLRDALIKPLINKGYSSLMKGFKKVAPNAYDKAGRAIKKASDVAKKVDKGLAGAQKGLKKIDELAGEAEKLHDKLPASKETQTK